MASVEIERKFLVKNDLWKSYIRQRYTIIQGYLFSNDKFSTRIRKKNTDFTLTIKITIDTMSRYEFNYPIPRIDGQKLLSSCENIVEKTRYQIEYHNKIWELDEFKKANAGLVLSEIELTDKNQPFDIPPWIDKEVTEDKQYYNSELAKKRPDITKK